MTAIRVVGIILIVAGLMGLIFQGIPYKSQTETIQFGPIQATAEERKSIPLPPLVAGAVLCAGIILLVVGGKK